jgi:hypothetical protein
VNASQFQTFSPELTVAPTLQKRILRLSTIWATLGALVGASLGKEAGGFFGAVLGMFLGISELTTLGVVFALIGGRPQETILGAIGGLLGSLAVGMMEGPVPIVLLAVVGLVVGAIAGALHRACILVLSFLIIVLGRALRTGDRTREPG